MNTMKIRRVGDELVVTLPPEMLAELGLGEGDDIVATAKEGAISFSAPDHDFAEQMAQAEKIMDRYRNALAELAK